MNILMDCNEKINYNNRKDILKTLYIHIGQHKTGSTSLQVALLKSKENLNKQNISYFHEGLDKKKHSININRWIGSHENILNNDKSEIRNISLLVQKISCLNDNVIISAEALSWIFKKEYLLQFKKELDGVFNKIIIISYLRRQDKQVVSHHQQGAKSITLPARIFYGDSPLALPENRDQHRKYLDYNQRIGMWADVFGDENIYLRIFDRKYLYKGDITEDFCNLLDIKGVQPQLKNESMGFEKTKVKHLMIALKIRAKDKISKIISNNLDNSGKLLPSQEKAKKLYLEYKESNIALNKRFKINDKEALFDEDFSSYPEVTKDEWTEESANQAISNILSAINDTYGKINVQQLNRVLDRLEEKDTDIAKKLKDILKPIL